MLKPVAVSRKIWNNPETIVKVASKQREQDTPILIPYQKVRIKTQKQAFGRERTEGRRLRQTASLENYPSSKCYIFDLVYFLKRLRN